MLLRYKFFLQNFPFQIGSRYVITNVLRSYEFEESFVSSRSASFYLEFESVFMLWVVSYQNKLWTELSILLFLWCNKEFPLVFWIGFPNTIEKWFSRSSSFLSLLTIYFWWKSVNRHRNSFLLFIFLEKLGT